MCLKERIWCGTENVSLISNFNWNIFLVYAKMYVETFSSDIWNCRRGEHMTKRVTKKAERKTGQRTVQGRNRADEKFIMLPTVDFCFKELMQNAKVRKGIIAALLGVSPEEIEETTLLPTILRKEYEDDKYGILDVHVQMKNGIQIDFEMQVEEFDFWEKRIVFYLSKMITIQKCIHVSILDFIHFPGDDRCYRKITLCDTETGEVYTDIMEIYVLELGKLPPEDQNEEGIVRWMRFFNAKNRKELEEMAKQNEYMDEAYQELDRLSADEEKRLEYETRLKYRRDKHAQIHYATRIGREEATDQINALNKQLLELGRLEDLKRAVEDKEYQKKLMKEFGIS